MTDDTLEGAPATDETEELVVPEVLEEEQEVQQPSVPLSGLTEQRLIEILDKRAETQARKDQSAKDRAISRNAKDIADILERYESGGRDQAAFIAEADQQATVEATQTWQANIESRLTAMASANTKQGWRDEWDVESQKILDAAEADDGVTLTNEEYNAAFFGQKFASRGDAYIALTRALSAKRRGEPTPVPASAVVTESGEVSHTPAPVTPQEPKPFHQQLEEAETAEAKDDVLKAKWQELEDFRAVEAAKKDLEARGIKASQLLE